VRAFLELDDDHRVSFDYLLDSLCASAKVARAFPGRTSARAVFLMVDLTADLTASAVEVLKALSSVETLNISTQCWPSHGWLPLDVERLEAGARRLAAALPWAAIRGVQLDCERAAECSALIRFVGSPVLGLRSAPGSLAILAAVLSDKDKLARVERLYVECEDELDNRGVLDIVRAMPTIAALPPRCALAVSTSLCSNALAVQLLRSVLSPEGGRRSRVEVVYACDDALKRLYVHAAVACVSARVGDVVTVDVFGRELDPQPDRDWAVALRRLSAAGAVHAFVATAWTGQMPRGHAEGPCWPLRNPRPASLTFLS